MLYKWDKSRFWKRFMIIIFCCCTACIMVDIVSLCQCFIFYSPMWPKLLQIFLLVNVDLANFFLFLISVFRFLKWTLTGTMVTLCLILGAPTARVTKLVVWDRWICILINILSVSLNGILLVIRKCWMYELFGCVIHMSRSVIQLKELESWF